MAKRYPFAFVLWLLCRVCVSPANAQSFPEDGDTLRQTSVCFTFPWHANAASYSVGLVDEAKPREVESHTGKGNKIVVNGLQWGHSYTWFVASLNAKGETVDVSNPTRFSLAPRPLDVRFVAITDDSVNRGNDLLLLDYAHTAFTRTGEPVWYLSGIGPNTGIRDLRLTDDGTLTAIIDSNALEMDLRGNVLWKAPLRGTRPDYHHGLVKLHSGNYLTIACDYRRYALPGRTDSARVDVGTVIEFTPDGKIAWQWNGRDFFEPGWISFKPDNRGGYMGSVHLNAVSADGAFVYAGFRDAGWILKINRATRKVEALYGGKSSKLPGHYAQGTFRLQHDAHLLKDGSLALINNDSVEAPGVSSSLVVLSQGKMGAGAEVWKFPFDFDGKTNGKSQKLGNVTELPNGHLLLNMGTINRLLEITRDKKVLWDVWVEKYDGFKHIWRFYPQYHVDAVSSLYPNEFSAKAEGRRDTKGWTGTLTLVNVGSETNAYEVWGEKKGKPALLAEIPALPPGGEHRGALTVPGEQDRLGIRVKGKSKRETVLLPNAIFQDQ